MSNSLRSHLDERIKKHRALDNEVKKLSQHHNVSEELRRIKTKKLWFKDEIQRIRAQLETTETRVNGHT